MQQDHEAGDEEPLDPALARLIDGLPRDAVPPEGQWAAIRPRLAPRIAQRRLPWMALAAAAAVLLMVALWSRRSAIPTMVIGPAPAVPTTPTGTAPAAPADAPGTVPADTPDRRVPAGPPAAERQTWDPRAFEAALAARTDLDAATLAALRRNMAVIDSAVADSRRALNAAPADPELGALVQFGESQRRALLAQLARLQES